MPRSTPGDYVQVSVSDTGAGMTPEVIERCFEPFFTTKGIGKGTGLGLSMVYGFVKQSGGHIKIYSEVGHGTTVKIYLPRARRAARPQAARRRRRAMRRRRARELVLMVEDNKDLRTVTLKQLTDLGYRTLEAENAKAALKILAERSGDRPAVHRHRDAGRHDRRPSWRAKRGGSIPRLKILLTSGYTARAMANGFHDIEGLELLNKPFRKRDLAQRLRTVLERK